MLRISKEVTIKVIFSGRREKRPPENKRRPAAAAASEAEETTKAKGMSADRGHN